MYPLARDAQLERTRAADAAMEADSRPVVRAPRFERRPLRRMQGRGWLGSDVSSIADPEVVEEVKWRKPSSPGGVPVWSHGGIVCTGETYKDKVKLTFARGASLADPTGLFNSSLDGNARRAIDIREGDTIDEKAFKALIRAAVALNTSKQTK